MFVLINTLINTLLIHPIFIMMLYSTFESNLEIVASAVWSGLESAAKGVQFLNY